MPKKGEPPATYEVDSEFLLGMAARLEYIAKRYREIAAQIQGDERLLVTGKPTAEKSEGLLRGWMATLQGGLDDAALGNLPTNPAAAEAVAKLKRRRGA